MRQRVIKVLAAFLLIVAGVTATAVVASAVGQQQDVQIVSPDSNQWD
jgi:hypothetical protein